MLNRINSLPNFKKELIRTAIAIGIGIIVSIICISKGINWLAYIAPFYAVGLLYGWRDIKVFMGKAARKGSKSNLFSAAALSGGGECLVLSLLLFILAIVLLPFVLWVLGVTKCIMTLINTYKVDMEAGRNLHTTEI